MSEKDLWKRNAARKAANLVEDEMLVGLGSGSTLAEVVKILGDRGSEAEFVVASIATQRLAERVGLNLASLEKRSRLDITIDGADEIDPNFNMIKGGGGAHTREKMVASAAVEVAIVVDKTKLVMSLGEKSPVPVEVVPFAVEYIAGVLEDFGGETTLRNAPTGETFVTDNNNYILDFKVVGVENPKEFEKKLNLVPGVLENGIFVDLVDKIFVGNGDGCKVISSKKEFLDLIES